MRSERGAGAVSVDEAAELSVEVVEDELSVEAAAAGAADWSVVVVVVVVDESLGAVLLSVAFGSVLVAAGADIELLSAGCVAVVVVVEVVDDESVDCATAAPIPASRAAAAATADNFF